MIQVALNFNKNSWGSISHFSKERVIGFGDTPIRSPTYNPKFVLSKEDFAKMACREGEDALLKYGRKDNDGDLYLTADAWNEYTKESTWASDSARRTAISEAKKKLVDESMIEQKGAGYVVIDADMKAALHLMVKNT